MNIYFTYKQKGNKLEKIPYKFPNKKDEDEYIAICEEWCGCIPCDITWAKGTKPYQRILNKINKI